MTNNPLVTIAIPAYKAAYLERAIRSALSQTYSNVEVLVVDDRSPEHLKDVVDRIADPRLTYVLNPENLGGGNPARNWNRCLELSHGLYFALLCDDDWYEPTFVERLLRLAELHPECGVFRVRASVVDAEGREVDRYPSAPEWESLDDYLWHVARGYRTQTISEWMFRTQTIREAGGYVLLPMAWYADYLSIYHIARKGGIASVSQVLAHFRQSGDNISSRDSDHTQQKIEAALQYRQQVALMLEGHRDRDMLLFHLDRLLKIHTKYNLDHATRPVLWTLLKKRSEYGLHLGWLWHAFWTHKKSK